MFAKQFLSKIFLIGLIGHAAAMPAEDPTKASMAMAKPPSFAHTNIPVPPGLDISKHKTPPKGFKVPTHVHLGQQGNLKRPSDALQKRQTDPGIAYLYLWQDWYYGGEAARLDVYPNSVPFVIGWYTDLDDNASSIEIYSAAYPEKACAVFRDWYYDGNGNVQCSGDGLVLYSGYGTPSSYAISTLVGDLNDSLSCAFCWVDY
ncbi:hypothetical protein AA313_de0202654 [Arthrobotrys entomopaga]|nr:hypothetical protein AA313_de0202654 [Arthrobotrys entomopaga]